MFHIVLLLIVFTVYHLKIHWFLDNKAELFYNNNKSKIYDLVHENFPNFESYKNIRHIFTILCCLSILMYPQLIVEYIGFLIVILLLRSISIQLTVLPKDPNCKISPNNLLGGCYDKIFSGHFSSVLLLTLIYLKHNIISLPMALILNILNATIILLTRGHYTIDIFVAAFVTTFVYQNNIRIV